MDEMQKPEGARGKLLMTALDKVMKLQTSAIENYVDWVRSHNKDASPAEVQAILDKHIMLVGSSTGAGAGAASAIPGFGFFMGAAAIGAESLVFLDAAAFYIMASAHLRGIDIRDEERRKALILLVLLGAQGTAIVDTLVSTEAGGSVASTVSRFSVPKLSDMNKKLMNSAMRRASKRVRTAWLGKFMPLGIGAVLGTVANRKLVRRLLENTHHQLGEVPSNFDTPAPEITQKPKGGLLR